MKQFQEMMRKMTSSPLYYPMLRFVRPLKDHFGVNHFWYYRITFSGYYSYLGTHLAWSEYCLDASMIDHFACLRHPQVLQSGISLMKAGDDEKYKRLLEVAWDKFHIHFSLNLIHHVDDGMEAFGFGTQFNDPKNEERLLNELPLLIHFTKVFRQRHQKLFSLLDENQADLSSYLGPTFYEQPKRIALPFDRALFWREMGCALPAVTPREIDILKLLSNGFPAPYIAQELHLSVRTVENYLAGLKSKLACRSKVELIQKAQEIVAMSCSVTHKLTLS